MKELSFSYTKVKYLIHINRNKSSHQFHKKTELHNYIILVTFLLFFLVSWLVIFVGAWKKQHVAYHLCLNFYSSTCIIQTISIIITDSQPVSATLSRITEMKNSEKYDKHCTRGETCVIHLFFPHWRHLCYQPVSAKCQFLMWKIQGF